MSLGITLNNGELVSVDIDEKTVLTKKLMTNDVLNAQFTVNKVIPIGIGSYTEVNGIRYYVYQLPTIKKGNNNAFNYTVIFSGKLHRLKQKALISSDELMEFSYVGTALDFITMIVASISEIEAMWIVGSVATTTKQKIEFYNDTCYTALYKVAQTFNLEFQLQDQTINLQPSIGTIKNLTFEYGQSKGFYSIERRIIANAPHYTRVYGFGASKNIPYTYRDRAKRLIFEEKYLEKEITTYGIKEGIYINDSIFPQRTSTLTAASIVFNGAGFDNNNSYIEDSLLDFNINDYLLEGQVAKIVFKTGDLSGYEFEIWKYENDVKRIYINSSTEGDGYTTPNENLKPKVGDEYTLVDIDMPPSYVIQAEADLKAATQRYLDDNSIPKTMYIVEIDPKYIKDNSISLAEGDIATIKDDQLGVDRPIRIVQISYPFINSNKITAIIADEIPYLRKQLDNIELQRTNNQVQAVTQNITNVTNVSNTNTTVIDSSNTIIINGRKFFFVKGFDNVENLTVLEGGDYIYGNLWDRFTYVKNWQYKGNGLRLELRTSWEEIETLEKEQV
jgi:hypothetical protein